MAREGYEPTYRPPWPTDEELLMASDATSGEGGSARRDCGTGAGGFKPGNKCAGGGGAGAGDSGASGGGSSGSVEQAKPGDGPLVKAAREEHKKALDKFRKSIEVANTKAEETQIKAMNDHIDAKEALAGQWSKVNELTTKYEDLLAQGQQDAKNEALWERVRQAGSEVTQAKVGLEPFEKAEAAAKKAKDKAAEDRRTATARAFKKEIAAIDKEDGITAAERKTIADAIERHNRRGESFAGSGFESEQMARSQYAASVRTDSQQYLREHVNNTIHASALQGAIAYEDGVRASAGGGVFVRDDGTEFGAVGTTRLDPTDKHRTFVHEFGHQIEHGNPEARSLTEDFLRSRIGASEAESLKERFPTAAYRDDERGLPDDFAKAFAATGEGADESMRRAYYTGKDYRSKDREAMKMKTPTEVLSMGMELMYRDPIRFAKADPEWFDLVSGIVTGRLLKKTRQQRKRKQ